MIVAGEASGDLHGGALASALFKKDPTLRIIGIGGPAMKDAGVDIGFDCRQLGMMGFSELFFKISAIWKGYQAAKSMLTKADLLVLIDFPDFNLRIAKIARQLGIPVVYYIGPQLWAWRAGRINVIKERVDKMLVIFPFEEAFYKKADIPCEFVGHPLLDKAAPLLERSVSKRDYLIEKGLNPDAKTIALLPGSRESEIHRHLPIMLAGISQLSHEIPDIQILIPVAHTIPITLIENMIRSSSLPIRLVTGDIYSLLRVTDAAVVVSGTATLDAALTETPMIIIYKTSALTYALARHWVRIPHLGLVNIVANAPLVPELIQGEVTANRICEEMKRILDDPNVVLKMKAGLRAVVTSLGKEGASNRAADAVYDLLPQKRRRP